MKLDFTDSEWMSIIDGDRDGLPRCCVNISALRDDLINAARNGGEIQMFEVERMRMTFGWVEDGHDLADLPLIQRVRTALIEAGKPPIHQAMHAEL